MTRSPNPKLAKLCQSEHGPSHVTYLYISGSLYIYGTAKDTNFIFGALIDDKESMQKFAKLGQMGTWP